jgi:hypothetical protein
MIYLQAMGRMSCESMGRERYMDEIEVILDSVSLR